MGTWLRCCPTARSSQPEGPLPIPLVVVRNYSIQRVAIGLRREALFRRGLTTQRRFFPTARCCWPVAIFNCAPSPALNYTTLLREAGAPPAVSALLAIIIRSLYSR